MTDAQVLRNLSLLSTSAARQLVEDPLLLALQGARRLPGPWRERVARAIGTGADDGELRRALWRSEPRSAVGRRLAAELAVQLGGIELCRLDVDDLPASIRARDLWARGHLSAAVRALDGVPDARAHQARRRSQLAMMSPRSISPGSHRQRAGHRPTRPNHSGSFMC